MNSGLYIYIFTPKEGVVHVWVCSHLAGLFSLKRALVLLVWFIE